MKASVQRRIKKYFETAGLISENFRPRNPNSRLDVGGTPVSSQKIISDFEQTALLRDYNIIILKIETTAAPNGVSYEFEGRGI